MKRSTIEEIQRMYDETAGSYNRMMDSEIGLPIYSDILSRLSRSIADTKGMLLDTSCGPGHMLELYHNRYDEKRQLVGIDLSPVMIDLTNQKFEGTLIQTLIGDMRDLSRFESASAAAVISFFAIHHLNSEDLLTTFKEWSRVLCRQGQMILAAWEGTGLIDYGDEIDVVAHKYTMKEIESRLIESGFVIEYRKIEAYEDLQMDAVYLAANKR